MINIPAPILTICSSVLLLGIALVSPASGAATDFQNGWRFHAEDVPAEGGSFDDVSWETVTIPHPVRIEARGCGKDNNPQWEGVCWYRKTIEITPEMAGKVVWVRFEGATFKGFRYTPDNTGDDCKGVEIGTLQGGTISPSVPDLTWEFWEQQ